MNSRGYRFWKMKDYDNFRVYKTLMSFAYQRGQERLFGSNFLIEFLKKLRINLCFNNERPYLSS